MSRLLRPLRPHRGEEEECAAEAHQAKSRLATLSRVRALKGEGKVSKCLTGVGGTRVSFGRGHAWVSDGPSHAIKDRGGLAQRAPSHLQLRDRGEQRLHAHTSVEDEVTEAGKAAQVGLKKGGKGGTCSCELRGTTWLT